jgi:hypothetical protein
MRKLLSVWLTVFCAVAVAACATPTEQKELAVEKSRVVTVTATVEALDLANRMVTLRGPEGNTITFRVDETVKNLPQVEVGDEVVVRYYQSVAVRMAKPGESQGEAVFDLATAKPGERPGGLETTQVTITASIEAIDKEQSLVTLKGPEGNLETVKVVEPKYLDRVKVGDRIAITYTEALAISVEEVKK